MERWAERFRGFMLSGLVAFVAAGSVVVLPAHAQQQRRHPYRHWGGQAFYRLHHSSPSGITWATALRSATSHFRAAC